MSRSSGDGPSRRWNQALTNYAKTKDPDALPKDVLLDYDDHTITIYDGFKKAQYHALVLPRLPYKTSHTSRSSTSTLTSTGGQLTLGPTASGTIPPSHLRTLRDILSSPYASEVLQSLRTASDGIISKLQAQMRRDHAGKQWLIRRGFHAVPSMDHLHLHVISDDLVSDRLKHKKHYLSFHPTHGFWLDLDETLTYLPTKTLPHPPSHYESLLRAPLTSHLDGQVYATMPKLEDHLQQAWKDQLLRLSPARSTTSNTETTAQKRKASTASLEPGRVDRPDSQARTRRKAASVEDSETETEPEA